MHAGRHHRHASGSFICRESFSVYSRGMATLATLATLGADLLKNSALGWSLDGSLSPHLLPPLFFFNFNLGVAMVAMVAMPREYTENDSRQMKLPDAR